MVFEGRTYLGASLGKGDIGSNAFLLSTYLRKSRIEGKSFVR